MLHVDLLCDRELMPRLRLLEQYMETLDVRLHLHTEIPKPKPAVLIFAPAQTGATAYENDQAVELIGLYLEVQPEIEADYQVHIPSWPARSSDPDVEALAKFLHNPRIAAAQQRAKTAHLQAAKKREKARNIVSLVIAVAMLIGLTQLIPSKTEEDLDPDTAGEALPPTISPVMLEASAAQLEQNSVSKDTNIVAADFFEMVTTPVLLSKPSRPNTLPWPTQPCRSSAQDRSRALNPHACVLCDS